MTNALRRKFLAKFFLLCLDPGGDEVNNWLPLHRGVCRKTSDGGIIPERQRSGRIDVRTGQSSSRGSCIKRINDFYMEAMRKWIIKI